MSKHLWDGGRLLRAGKLKKAEIARQLGVSRATVGTWAKALEAGGLRHLRRRISSGRKSKLTAEQKKHLKRFLDRGALAAGYPTDRWTMVRVCELIQKEFDISYHPNALNRVLDEPILATVRLSDLMPLPDPIQQLLDRLKEQLPAKSAKAAEKKAKAKEEEEKQKAARSKPTGKSTKAAAPKKPERPKPTSMNLFDMFDK